MELIKKELSAVLLKPSLIHDLRGWFEIPFNIDDIRKFQLDFKSVCQLNHSYTKYAGIVRGPNYQQNPFQQSKIIRCIRGSLYSVGIDINPKSSNFRKYCGFVLSAENGFLMYVPRTYAHGFVTLEDNTELEYFTDEIYCSESAKSIAWNDSDIGIDWTFGNSVKLKCDIMSEKNKNAPRLREILSNDTTG